MDKPTDMTDEEFVRFLAGFRGRACLQMVVGQRRVDHELFVELLAKHDEKVAELIGDYLEAARRMRDYIEQCYLVPAGQPQPEPVTIGKDAN